MRPSRWILLALFALVPAGLAAAGRAVTDMAGVSVPLPDHVRRVATVGPVPVLNSLVFAIGEGGSLVNGLATFARRPRWGYQFVFAPQLANGPAMQNVDMSPNLEALLGQQPDVVLTMDRAGADQMRRAGLRTVYLAWRKPEDVKQAVRLLGEVYGKPAAAERYERYFDAALARVGERLGGPALVRPRVLYFSPATLTQPHLVAEWWIRAAGGDSVTDDGRQFEARNFSLEQLLAWDPDFLLVADPSDVDVVRNDRRLAGLRAVQAGRVLVVPCGAHTWGNRTAEQPLTVLWAARHFHPQRFADIDLQQETRRFYADVFGVTLSPAQVAEILAGGPRQLPVAR
jgi:iron complex transport system substrate-binding protein